MMSNPIAIMLKRNLTMFNGLSFSKASYNIEKAPPVKSIKLKFINLHIENTPSYCRLSFIVPIHLR